MEFVALTKSFARFTEPDLLTLKAAIEDYRGPVQRVMIEAHGAIYTSTTIWVSEDGNASGVALYTATQNRVDAERLDNSISENIEAMGRRTSSI